MTKAEYLDAIAADVQKLIAHTVRARGIPLFAADDVCCSAALIFVRRARQLPVAEVIPGELPDLVKSAVHFSIRTAVQKSIAADNPAIIAAAVDIAIFRSTINRYQVAAELAAIDDEPDSEYDF